MGYVVRNGLLVPKRRLIHPHSAAVLRALPAERRNMTGAMFGGVGTPAYAPPAVAWGGAPYLKRASTLTGGPNSGKFTASIFFRVDGGVSTLRTLFSAVHAATGGGGPEIYVSGGDALFVNNYDDSFSSRISFFTNTLFAISSAWHWLATSYDFNQVVGARAPQLYIDGASDLHANFDSGPASANRWDTLIDDIEFAAESGSSFWSGATAVGWIAPGVQLDWSSATVQAKFFTGLHPVNPGADGSTPTGTAPLILINNAFGAVNINLGSGGDFVTNGSPSSGAPGP